MEKRSDDLDIKEFLLSVLNNKEILDILPDKKVFFLHADNPNKNLYLEYEIINEYGEEFSEGKEDFTTYIIQIDIFSTKSYTKLEKIIKKHMKENGFSREMAADLYEEKTKLNHKAMRFNITLETNES